MNPCMSMRNVLLLLPVMSQSGGGWGTPLQLHSTVGRLHWGIQWQETPLTPHTKQHLALQRGTYTVEPPIMDTEEWKEWTTSLQWTHCSPLPIFCPYISASEEGTTSEQWTKCSSPICPLFGGSTVSLLVTQSYIFTKLFNKLPNEDWVQPGSHYACMMVPKKMIVCLPDCARHTVYHSFYVRLFLDCHRRVRDY